MNIDRHRIQPPLSAPIVPVGDLVHMHERALYTVQYRGVPIPSLEDMEAFLRDGDTISSLEKDIEKLEKEYDEDLRRIYDLHAAEYHLEAQKNYNSEHKMDRSLKDYPRIRNKFSAKWDDDVERCRQDHQKLLSEYRQRLEAAKKVAAEAEERQRRQFPTSIADYKKKRPEMQKIVAQFLTAESKYLRDALMTKHGWAWRQVQPLLDECKQNQEFMSFLQAEQISSHYTSANITRDPKKRPA